MSNLYLGTQGYGSPSWVGPFYPPGTPIESLPEHSARAFNTVELDTTFYAVPRVAAGSPGWRERTPPGFRFAAKFPQVITHEKGLVNSAEDAAGLYRGDVGTRGQARPTAPPDATCMGRRRPGCPDQLPSYPAGRFPVCAGGAPQVMAGRGGAAEAAGLAPEEIS